MPEDFFIYRRNLPHWRLSGSVYFLTWRMHEKQSELQPAERTLVASAIKHFDGQRYKLYGYVVMNDHCHALLEPRSGYTIQQIMYSWKSFTANRLQREHGRIGAVWQREYFDRIMRDENEFIEKLQYIVNNPQKRWPGAKSYQWVEWFRWDA